MPNIVDKLLNSERKNLEQEKEKLSKREDDHKSVQQLLKKFNDEELLALFLYQINNINTGCILCIKPKESHLLNTESSLYKDMSAYIEKRLINDLRGEHPFDSDEYLKMFFVQAKAILKSINLEDAVSVTIALQIGNRGGERFQS